MKRTVEPNEQPHSRIPKTRRGIYKWVDRLAVEKRWHLKEIIEAAAEQLMIPVPEMCDIVFARLAAFITREKGYGYCKGWADTQVPLIRFVHDRRARQAYEVELLELPKWFERGLEQYEE